MSATGLRIGLTEMFTGRTSKHEVTDLKGYVVVSKGKEITVNGVKQIAIQNGTLVQMKDGSDILTSTDPVWLAEMVKTIKKSLGEK